jgi:hypothetical protein
MKKFRPAVLFALCATMFGAGIGATSAQVYDWRCQSCDWSFQSCIQQCDYNGGEEGCYSACIAQRRVCKATFCT